MFASFKIVGGVDKKDREHASQKCAGRVLTAHFSPVLTFDFPLAVLLFPAVGYAFFSQLTFTSATMPFTSCDFMADAFWKPFSNLFSPASTLTSEGAHDLLLEANPELVEHRFPWILEGLCQCDNLVIDELSPNKMQREPKILFSQLIVCNSGVCTERSPQNSSIFSNSPVPYFHALLRRPTSCSAA